MRYALWMVVTVGCFHPTPPEGAPCDPSGACPSPLECLGGVCRSGELPIDSGADADPSCSCAGGNTLSCAGGMTTCALGCASNHCLEVVPSNGVVPMFPMMSPVTAIANTATFNTDTGAVTGSIVRASGEGITNNIGYAKQTFGAVNLGVFSFGGLTVTGAVHFTGTRDAVFIVETTAEIDGTIDASAGCYGSTRKCAGPGGGVGAIYTASAGGCGAGGPGITNANGIDTGGGGGGGGGDGANGADDTESAITYKGGTGGAACIAATLEPLGGGGGGEGGGPGAGTATAGGGGGGGFQLTALHSITIRGSILSSGAGGEGGPLDLANLNGGSGGGGGAGGGILLEAPTVTTTSAAVVAANGGGGGGSAATGTAGGSGENGHPSAAVAIGGIAAGGGAGIGGNGGALGTPATIGGSAHNSGAGGGGVGVIYVRGMATLGGVISPAAGTGTIRTR